MPKFKNSKWDIFSNFQTYFRSDFCLPELWLAFFLYFLIMFLFLFFLRPQCCSPRWPSKWSRNYRGRDDDTNIFSSFFSYCSSALWVPSSSRAIGKLLKKWLCCWEGYYWEVQQQLPQLRLRRLFTHEES